jgi:hypothetical protein
LAAPSGFHRAQQHREGSGDGATDDPKRLGTVVKLVKAVQPEGRTRVAGTMKLPAINLSRSSSLDWHASRNAWIAAPTAVSFQNQSPSCRLDGLVAVAAAASRQ